MAWNPERVAVSVGHATGTPACVHETPCRTGVTELLGLAAAAVARATLYRYFPSRQALLDELGRVAADEAGSRLASARIEEVAAREGITRAVRALIEVGDPFTVVARERVRPDPEQFEQLVLAPLRRLFERAQQAGEIRGDIPSSWLTDALVGLVVSVLSSRPVLGREDTIAALAALFLEGARSRPTPVSAEV